MIALKSRFRRICPASVVQFLRQITYKRSKLIGPYCNWETANDNSSGYDSQSILAQVERATDAVLERKAEFERNGALFSSIEYSFPSLAALLRVAALAGGRLSVLDFGGSLGSTYRQNRVMLDGLTHLRWSVVEQRAFVSRGRLKYQTGTLRFYESIAESLAEERPDIFLFSGVLQYLDDPYRTIDEAVRSGVRSILIDRTPVHKGTNDLFAVQKVSGHPYEGSYPARIFASGAFERCLSPQYKLIVKFRALDSDMTLGKHDVRFMGFFFELKSEAEKHEL